MSKPPDFSADLEILDVAAIIFILVNPFRPTLCPARAQGGERSEAPIGCQPNFRHHALPASSNQLLLSYQIYLITLVPVTALAGKDRPVCRCM